MDDLAKEVITKMETYENMEKRQLSLRGCGKRPSCPALRSAVRYMLTISDKPSLQKKYYGYYNSYLKDKMDRVFIGECLPILKSLQRRFCSSKVSDNRSPDRQIYISATYLQGLKELLYRVFDFAYNKKYIKNHPMYQLDDWTAYKKKDNSYGVYSKGQ